MGVKSVTANCMSKFMMMKHYAVFFCFYVFSVHVAITFSVISNSNEVRQRNHLDEGAGCH